MGKRANFLRALTSTLLIALQEIAELLVVLTFLLFDGHDVLKRLLEVHQVQVEVRLVLGKLGYFFSENCHITLLKVLLSTKTNKV